MGYGVSDGAAGRCAARGSAEAHDGLLVLIDGHPQYMGLMGHPIADAYQSMLAERVEVVRGPASVLYGSNAMGGVINIVTRRHARGRRENRPERRLRLVEHACRPKQPNRIRKGRFTSVVTGSYNRTDGHRADMGFEQYGGYAKVGYEISRRWNAYADVNLTHFNASNPGEITAPVLRQRLPHHARHGIRLTGKLVRPDFGRVEASSTTGAVTGSMTATAQARSRATTVSTRRTGCWASRGIRAPDCGAAAA